MDGHGRNHLVRYLDAHHRDLVGDGGDAHTGSTQSQGNIVGQIGQLVETHALIQLQLIPGDRGAAHHVDNVGVDAEGVDGITEPLTVGTELAQGLSPQLPLSLLEQFQGRVLVRRRLLRESLLDMGEDLLSSLLALLLGHLGHSGLPDDLRHSHGSRGRRHNGGRFYREGNFLYRFCNLSLRVKDGVGLNGRRRSGKDGIGRRFRLCLDRLRFRRNSFLGLCRAGLGSTSQQLIGSRHPGYPVKEAALALLQCRSGLGLLAHQRSILYRDIDVGGSAPSSLGLHSGSRCGSLTAGTLRDLLGLVLRAVEDPVGHIHNGAVKGPKSQKQEGQHKDHGGADAAEHLDKGLGHGTRQGAAASHGLASGPQGLKQSGIPGQHWIQKAMNSAGKYPRQRQGACQAQSHRASPVEGQDIAAQQQSGRHQPKAVAKQSLDQSAEKVNEQRLHMEIAKGGEDG